MDFIRRWVGQTDRLARSFPGTVCTAGESVWQNPSPLQACRVIVSQRIPRGMCLMYHAQEKIVNTPGSELSGKRGGIHNSVTRTVLKPTHMIGGYAQLAYGFNYYGTIGSNRDEFVLLRKMSKVDWMDEPVNAETAQGEV